MTTPREKENPEHAEASKIYDHWRIDPTRTAKANVTNSSQSFEDILGALPEFVVGVTVTVRDTSGTVHVANDGSDATTSDVRLLPSSDGRGDSETFVGSKAELDAYQFLGSAATVDCDFRVYVAKDPTA